MISGKEEPAKHTDVSPDLEDLMSAGVRDNLAAAFRFAGTAGILGEPWPRGILDDMRLAGPAAMEPSSRSNQPGHDGRQLEVAHRGGHGLWPKRPTFDR